MAAVARIHSAHGAQVEFGTFTLDPASVAAASQGVETVTVSGAKVGDLVFVNAEALDNRLAVVGAKVTATNTVSVYLNNMYDATTAVNGGSKTYSYILVKLS
jgi:hypothetical protein